MAKETSRSKPAVRMPSSTRDGASQSAAPKKTPVYEPPLLTKFDKLDKLIVCGE
jgi:hypothetical protein